MEFSTSVLMAIAGLVGGLALGFVARWSHFCTLGALEDAYFAGDFRRLKAWALAIAVGIVLVHIMRFGGVANINDAVVMTPQFRWASAIIGGLMFGVGMALNGTCGFGTLARIGGGDLKAVVTFLVMGVAAYATIGGITAMFRVGITDQLAVDLSQFGTQSLTDIASSSFGVPAGIATATAAAIGLVWWALSGEMTKIRAKQFTGSVIVGLVIGLGWYVTATLGQAGFEPQRVESFSFVRPLGNSILYIMTSTGATVDFGIGATFGVIAGAALTALFSKKFRWEACDDARELRRHIFGAIFMGVGGIMSLGCTVGQGLSAAAALTVSAPVVLICIAIGARLGLRYLIEGKILPSGWPSLFSGP
ncbi:MAG: YeeE/YedE family protein [Alphaproteobacteria bacterium]